MDQSTSVGSAENLPIFSGSYDKSDVEFLLEQLSDHVINSLYKNTDNKEQLIQSGQVHYSQMLSREHPPEPAYLSIFESAMARHALRVAKDISALAAKIDDTIDGPITLCSLVRAGLPIGVLLQRSLKERGRDTHHYGISIVRDKGIDTVAMDKIVRARPPEGVLFVDGWTGKGAISTQLESSIEAYGNKLLPRLVTLADPAGRAWMAASHEDWLIPSGILGSTVSGLISRSVITRQADNDAVMLHGAAYLRELASYDLSRRYVDEVTQHGLVWPENAPTTTIDSSVSSRRMAEAAIDRVAVEFDITNRNRIKPGIAEATRAVLRRVPDKILIAGVDDPDLRGIQYLATKNNVSIEERITGLAPYRAITIIADVTKT